MINTDSDRVECQLKIHEDFAEARYAVKAFLEEEFVLLCT